MEKTGALGLGANEPDAVRASAAEFILEGLYAHRRISRNEESGFIGGERKRERRRPSRGAGRRRRGGGSAGSSTSRQGITMKCIRFSKYTRRRFRH